MSEFRRRLMLAQGGGALPYDAEVEYIEANGSQYIDTGINFAVGMICELFAVYTGGYTSTQILTAPSSSGGCWFGNVNKNSGAFGFGTGNGQYLGSSRTKTSLKFQYYNNNTTRLYSNGTTASLSRGTNPTTTTMKIFSNGNAYYSQAKLYIDNIFSGGNLVREYKPVRKDGKGYLYDCVSGLLFGDENGGSFTYGSDITTWSPCSGYSWGHGGIDNAGTSTGIISDVMSMIQGDNPTNLYYSDRDLRFRIANGYNYKIRSVMTASIGNPTYTQWTFTDGMDVSQCMVQAGKYYQIAVRNLDGLADLSIADNILEVTEING